MFVPAVMTCAFAAGKTSLVRCMALLCNQPLVEVALTAGSDTSDILGGFEQLEPRRKVQVRDYCGSKHCRMALQ